MSLQFTYICRGWWIQRYKNFFQTILASQLIIFRFFSFTESDDLDGWLEKFLDAELASIVMKSELQLDEGFAPVDFQAVLSLEELFSSQQNPSRAAPRREPAPRNCKLMKKLTYRSPRDTSQNHVHNPCFILQVAVPSRSVKCCEICAKISRLLLGNNPSTRR